MVKVWDMNTNRAKEIYCVQTIASVARVKWRPECKHHIATCSMMVDHNIYVWDVRRPFIPSAMFEEHKDVTTGIVWRHLHDPYFLLSGSKDSTLYQHIFKDAIQPIDRANPEGLCYSLFGDLAFAAKESLISSDSNRKRDRRHPIFFKRKLDPTEQFEFISSSSALSVFEADTECDAGSMDWFVRTAKQYVLTGRPLAELCDHNAKVAKELKRNQVRAPFVQELFADTLVDLGRGVQHILVPIDTQEGDAMVDCIGIQTCSMYVQLSTRSLVAEVGGL